MSATVADVPLSLNLITLMVDLYTSVASDSKGTGLSNFCVGHPAATVHDPVKINQLYRCPSCSNEDKTTFVKGRKQGKGYVIVPADKVEEASAQTEKFGKGMEFTYHPSVEVESQTIPIDAPYYLAPQGPLTGQPAQVYALLAEWVATNPDVALLTRYAPRSSASTYRLTSRGGVLMLQKLCFPNDMHAAPAVPQPVSSAHADQLDAMIRSQITPFDPAQWVDRRKELLDGYAAEQTGSAVTGTPEAEATVVDLAELIKLSTKTKRARKPSAKKSA